MAHALVERGDARFRGGARNSFLPRDVTVALTELQREISFVLSANGTPTSYVARGLVPNREWSRLYDLDVFHDTDEEVADAARMSGM